MIVVLVVGAGPTGLMLAAELALQGIRPLVLERRDQIGEAPKAGGFSGQIVDVVALRGLTDRLVAAGSGAVRDLPAVPFGNDYLRLGEPSPIRGLQVPSHRLEAMLDARARELGADVRRGQRVVDLTQHADHVEVRTAGEVLEAQWVVGCDGGRSPVRELAGIGFPGVTYPEVNRLATVTLADSVVRRDDGGIELPGGQVIARGFTRTDRGVIAFGSTDPTVAGVQTTQYDGTDDGSPMTLDELQASVRRLVGAELPVTGVHRLTRYGVQARIAETYRRGRVLLAGDAAHQFPSTGVGNNVGMCDAVNLGWRLAAEIRCRAGLLDGYDVERRHAADRMMMQAQAQVTLRRTEDPAAEALRSLVFELLDGPAAQRVGAMIAGDAAYDVGCDHPLAGRFTPVVEEGLQRDGRPTVVEHEGDRLLLRPDGYVAWVGETGMAEASARLAC